MHELILPKEVTISELIKNSSLSPNNYKRLTIRNPKKHPASYYFDADTPYSKGIEPGSSLIINVASFKVAYLKRMSNFGVLNLINKRQYCIANAVSV